MFTETSIIDLVQVLEDGQLQVRQADRVLRDGIEIAKTYQRWVLVPGQDITEQDQKVKDIAAVVWTAEVIAAYQAGLPNA